MPHPSHSLLTCLQAHRRRVLLGALLVAASVSVGVAIPFLFRFAIDDLVASRMTMPRLFGYTALYVVAALVSGFFALAMRRVMLALGYTIEARLRRDIFAHLTRMDSAFYRGERTGDIMAKMTSDLQSIREFFSQGLLQGTRTLVGFVLAFAIMFYINVRMAFVVLLLLPAISVIFFLLLRLIHGRYEAVQEQYSNICNFVQESFAGIRVLKGFGIETRRAAAFGGLNEEHVRRNLMLNRLERRIGPLMGLLFALGVALLLLVGGRQVLRGYMSLGEFVQFNQYLFFLQWPMLALGWTSNLLQRGRTSWKRVRTLLEAAPSIRDEACTDHGLREVKGDIRFEKVSLHLENRAVLEQVDLVIPEGATVGITGPTGSGKTQLVSMIARLVQPTLGLVRIGGRDVREYPLEVLRAHIGMAPQEPFLFSDTLANNIAFGLSNTYEEQVLWAAEVAQLRRDVDLFPSGFQTVLGEKGVTLSGGQRQRTAISRAIARNPSILILDDVFSAIDTQTEARIIAQLKPVLRKRTSILISHRVSTLRDADFIIVIEAGRITQSGTHRELTAQPGYYRDLDEMQRLEARLEAG